MLTQRQRKQMRETVRALDKARSELDDVISNIYDAQSAVEDAGHALDDLEMELELAPPAKRKRK